MQADLIGKRAANARQESALPAKSTSLVAAQLNGSPNVQRLHQLRNLLNRPAPAPPPPAPDGDGVIQAYSVNYGGATGAGWGTTMDAEILQSDTVPRGSAPSVWPTGWPIDNPWFKSHVVRGHLLNQHLGGPGNDLANLTPITKSTNATHYHDVEKHVKAAVGKHDIRYIVEADYSSPPDMGDLGVPLAEQTPALAVAVADFPSKINADYSLSDPVSSADLGGAAMDIGNEGAHLK